MTSNFEVFRECGQSVNNENILSLTHEIMEKSGYKRIGGKNTYEKPLDNCLVAKWVYLCKDLFSFVDRKKYAKTFISDIISSTVKDFFDNVDLDVVQNESMLFGYIHKLIKWRTNRYTLYELRRRGKVKQRAYKRDKDEGKARYKFDSFEDAIAPIEQLDKHIEEMDNPLDGAFNPFDGVVEMLDGDTFAIGLFDGILRSNFEVNLKKVNDYIYVPKEQQTEEMKKKIADAYNRIRYASCYVLGREVAQKKITEKSIAFNGDGKYL